MTSRRWCARPSTSSPVANRPRHAALDDATLAQWSPERVRARYRAEILPEGPAVGTAAAEPGVAATGPADLDGADRPRPDA